MIGMFWGLLRRLAAPEAAPVRWSHLADHLVRIHRGTPVRDGVGDVRETYTAVGREWAAVVPPKRRLRDVGPGDQPAGEMEAYFRSGADLRARDVVEVTEGPEAGTVWRAQVPHRPRGHHTEVVLVPFTGRLT